MSQRRGKLIEFILAILILLGLLAIGFVGIRFLSDWSGASSGSYANPGR